MIYNLYSMRDDKISFMSVMMDVSDGSAIRNFQLAVTKPETVYSSFSDDFSLYRLGTFNSEDGVIKPEQPPVMVCRATDFKEV